MIIEAVAWLDPYLAWLLPPSPPRPRCFIPLLLVVLVDVGSDVEIDVGEAGPLSEKKVWQAGVGVGVGVLYVVDHVGVYCAVKFPLDAVMYVTMLV